MALPQAMGLHQKLTQEEEDSHGAHREHSPANTFTLDF